MVASQGPDDAPPAPDGKSKEPAWHCAMYFSVPVGAGCGKQKRSAFVPFTQSELENQT